MSQRIGLPTSLIVYPLWMFTHDSGKAAVDLKP